MLTSFRLKAICPSGNQQHAHRLAAAQRPPSARVSPSSANSESCSSQAFPRHSWINNIASNSRFIRHIASVAAADGPAAAGLDPDVEVSKAVTSIIQYAFNFARVSETYESHSWMVVLGLLKQEDCRAAKILKDMGLDDLYGAWHEVLWALNASNGLEPRAFTPEVRFSDRAFRILVGSANFANWGGRTKVQSEDVLMALAAGNVLTGLFPDLGLTFDNVRKAAAKHGCKYVLPDDNPEDLAAVATEEADFL